VGLTVTTAAASRRLARLGHVKAELGIADTSQDALLRRQIDDASAAIEAYCRRAFAREALTETLAGWDATELQLGRTPLVAVTSVLLDSEPVLDFSIESRDEAALYRRAGWAWTAQRSAGLTGRQRWPGFGAPLPRSEEPRFSVSYVAGYILPEQWLEDDTTVSVDAGDDSFNAAGKFPTLLQAGDVLVASGFAQPANNGRFVVTGTPTSLKVQVSAALTTEAAGASATIRFDPPGECRGIADLERACVQTVKRLYHGRAQDPDVVEKQVGQLRIRRGESDTALTLPLPAEVVGLLRPWVRGARAA